MHALIAHSYPDRWPCTRGRGRWRPRLDVRRDWARWRGRCRRPRRLHHPRRWPKRGALRHVHAACAMHVHTPDHLLNLTNMAMTGRSLHQPRACTSTDARNPARRPPQALRPPRGCRKAAAERCEGSHRGGRPGHCGCCRALHGRAGRRRWPRCVGQRGLRAGEAPAAGRSLLGRLAAALLVLPAGTIWPGACEPPRGEPRESRGRLGVGRGGLGRAPQPRWGWLGGQGPACRMLLVAGTSVRAP